MPETTAYLPAALTDNAVKTLRKRYLKRDDGGQVIETPYQLFRRVAKHVASAETTYDKSRHLAHEFEEEFYQMMASLKFLPNSPTLMNAGRELGQLSACFVLPVEDSMEGIFDAVKHAAMIHKSGGGTGFSFSRLRPAGDTVGSTKGVSSGPISFMTVFDTATEAVKQGGTRRGANMGMLRVDHPDILDFITCKDNTKKLTNFNISVALTSGFMEAVERDEAYDLINPRTKAVAGSLKAREVFRQIVHQAWKNGEPGIVFIDRINDKNPVPDEGEIESTNPCGEQPLLPYESCNLGSINLSLFADEACAEVNWRELERTVHYSVRFMDDVITVNKYPLPEIKEKTLRTRKVGLGVMGWADLLIKLGIPYNSSQAIDLGDRVMAFITEASLDASNELAMERGTFPAYVDSNWDRAGIHVRNATTTTIAPTGTLSILAGCSSGIEPLFAVAYQRTVLEGTKMFEVNPHFVRLMDAHGIAVTDDLIERIAEVGSIAQMEEIPADIRRVFLTAHDITPEQHVTMQATFQKHVHNAVSKTVNLCKSATEKDVEDAYLAAYRLGCCGVTVYRDGARGDQVLSTMSTAAQVTPAVTEITPRKRPTTPIGRTPVIRGGCGKLYITVNQDDKGKPFEVFVRVGKGGGCASAQAEALGRLVSLGLRCGISSELVVSEMKGIGCHQPSWGEGGAVTSCSDAIAKALEGYVPLQAENGNGGRHADFGIPPVSKNAARLVGACPSCGGAVTHEGGCQICHSCGWDACN